MKVLHIVNLYPYKDNLTYGIFVKEQIDSLQKYCVNDVYFINARKFGLLEYLKSINKLFIVSKNYDIIHCHHEFTGFIYLLIGKNKIKILSILGDINKRYFINRFIFKVIFNKFDKVVFKSKIPFNNSKFLCIPNGVNTNIFKPIEKSFSRTKLSLSNDNNIYYILFVANTDLNNPIKRIDKFNTIINRLNVNFTHKKFIPLYLNNIERQLVPFYFNASNLLILCSDHEGSPNAIKEALSCNLPIVATPVGDLPKLLKNVSNSFVSINHETSNIYNSVININFNQSSNGRDNIFNLGLDIENISLIISNLYKDLYYDASKN